MQGANKRLVRNSESTLTTTSRSRTPAVPEERIAKHLSERALTDGGHHVAAGDELSEGLRCKWYQENVLSCTKGFKFCVLYQENVLGGTKF